MFFGGVPVANCNSMGVQFCVLSEPFHCYIQEKRVRRKGWTARSSGCEPGRIRLVIPVLECFVREDCESSWCHRVSNRSSATSFPWGLGGCPGRFMKRFAARPSRQQPELNRSVGEPGSRVRGSVLVCCPGSVRFRVISRKFAERAQKLRSLRVPCRARSDASMLVKFILQRGKGASACVLGSYVTEPRAHRDTAPVVLRDG